MRGQIRNSGRAFWGLVPAAWEVRTGSLLSLQGGVSAFLTWGQGGVLTGAWLEAWARWCAHPFGGGVCRGPAQYLAFAPDLCFCSGLFRSGSWVFWSLCIFCPEFAPTVRACSQFWSHIVSLYFVAQERFVQVQVLQQRVPNPSLSCRDDGRVLLCLLGECL